MRQSITGSWVGTTSPLIRVGLTVDPDDMQAALIEEIFSGAGLPTTGSDDVTLDVTDPLIALGVSSSNTAQVDYHKLDIMDNDPAKIGTTEFWVFRPTVSNNRLVVLLLGHNPAGISVNTGTMGRDLIDAGYTVALGHFFPNLDAAGDPGYNDVGTHNALPDSTSSLNIIRYFVQGPIRIVNELLDEGWDYIFGVGQSGGGWEMVHWGAIDTRVKATCAHAGYWPLFVTNATRDKEQLLPLQSRSLAALVDLDYTDLAALATYPNRTHIQSMNTGDAGTFPKTQYDAEGQSYEIITRNVSRKFGGRYDLQFDTNAVHSYLENRRDYIVALFDSFP